MTGEGRGESSGWKQSWATQDIVVRVNEKTGETFTFFWGPGTVFSQWYPARFTVDGVEYNCAEQYMMYQKACELSVIVVVVVIDVAMSLSVLVLLHVPL